VNNKTPKQTKKRKKEAKGFLRFFLVFIKIFFMVTLIGGFAVIGILSGTLFGYVNSLEELNVKDLKLNFTSFVYYIDPNTNSPVELERLYGEENRIWVDSSQIPQHLKDAFVAIEDERFYSHPGFDLKRTTGAVINYVFKRSSSYGGSTITQQLVKNLTGDKEVDHKRKIREIWRAIQLEKELSKDQILELYLNTIYLSQNCNGVQAASNTYFGKDVSELTLAEAASIAGITQYPSRYDPFINPENNKNKQELVLKKMLELGYITESEYQQAVNEELKFAKGSQKQSTSKQSYFVDEVINDVMHDLEVEKGYSKAVASKMLYSGGLKIYATIDPNIQNAMDEVFKDDKNFPNIKGEVKPEAAMVVIDPYTGEVKGIVGGRGEKTASRTLNRATQSKRQPGSTIKPLAVYAPAVEYGYVTPATVFDDVPVTIANWSPKNYYKEGFRGLSTVRRAIEQSMNVVAVKVLNKVGIDNSFNFLKTNLGFTTLVDSEKRQDGKTYSDKNYAALALGGLTDGMTVEEMAAAYASFVNRGMYTRPYTYTKVLDHEGKVILENKKKTNIAMSEQTAFLMTQMLKGVVDTGTGTPARLSSGMPAAGKTGTTSDDMDRWFAGFTPYYVGVVWFGYDQPKEIVVSGTNPAIVLWKAVMEKIHKGLEIKQFSEPSGIVKASICIDSGHRPTELCSQDPRGSRVRTEYFKKGTVPSQTCSVHVSAKIDTSTNLLAGEHCPPSLIENRVFIVRPQAYTPASPNSPLPTDAKYQLPAKHCDVHGAENGQTDSEPIEGEQISTDGNKDTKNTKDSKDVKDNTNNNKENKESNVNKDKQNTNEEKNNPKEKSEKNMILTE